MVIKNVVKKGDYYYLEGSSQQFNSIAEISKHIRDSKRTKKENGKRDLDGRRFWSEKLQMPFRSNWEITIAELLTDLEIKFEYEPERFYFRAERESYLPDFYLPEYNCWLEVKGWMDKRSEKRCKLFKKYYGAEYGYFLVMKEEMALLAAAPEMIFTLIEIANKERQKRASQI